MAGGVLHEQETVRVARRNARHEAALKRIAALHRSVGWHVGQAERTTAGLRLRGSTADPRVPFEQVRSMTAAQRRSYEARLNSFNRDPAFVAGKGGAPVRQSTWERYEKWEARYNAKVAAYNERVKDFRVPGEGQTIGERRAMLAKASFPKPGGFWRVFEEIHRTVGGVTGEESLGKLTEKMRDMASTGYVKRTMAEQRRTLKEMMEKSGDYKTLDRVMELTDRQLQMLVDETDFMAGVGYRYTASMENGDPKNDEVFQDWGNRVDFLAGAAHSFPKQ